MARTFVRVELVTDGDGLEARFSAAMIERGFVETIRGRTKHQALRLPTGMYLIEKKTAVEALGLTRDAARAANVVVRIVCVPAGDSVRFGNLAVDDSTPALQT